jgi:hypothetical protein
MKTYSELGKLLDSMARKRNVCGPYAVAKRVTEVAGYQISGEDVALLFYGVSYPNPSFIAAFADAFELSTEERDRLAWFYIYGEEFPGER